MRIQLKALGCRLNEAELESWSQQFQAHGHQLAGEAEDADLMVVNTCAVTGEAVRKSRKLIRRLHRQNPEAKLVVSGCYVSLESSTRFDEMGVDLVVPNSSKDNLVREVTEKLDIASMPLIATEPGDNSLFKRGRQRAFIKVQDGCRYRCTFCIVTHARGDERSRSVADVISEINRLNELGVHEAVLTGVHIGGYGSDIDSNLSTLIKSVLAETDIKRLRLGSVEPWDLPDDFFSLFDDSRFMPHLHLPLQSGSDSVLRRMARRCKTDAFRTLVEKARSHKPDINITTDIIVGFPGETEAEWQATLDYVRALEFGHIHIFSYSPREGTKAATLPGQIDEQIKRSRSRELHELAHASRVGMLSKQIGSTLSVLHEEPAGDALNGRYWGYTPNFLRVATQAAGTGDVLTNRVCEVAVESVDTERGCLLARYPAN